MSQEGIDGDVFLTSSNITIATLKNPSRESRAGGHMEKLPGIGAHAPVFRG